MSFPDFRLTGNHSNRERSGNRHARDLASGALLFIIILMGLFVSSCQGSALTTPTPQSTLAKPTVTPVPSQTATAAIPTATVAPIFTPTVGPSGPVDYPPDVNRLSGLPVADPSLLKLPPALISVSNIPATSRPQAGLSFSPLVFEMYIGEGACRFLAFFYGEKPVSSLGDKTWIGPIRSGRLPYETLRQIYYGHLVFASASSRVLPDLDEYTIIQNPDLENINGARIMVKDLFEISRERLSKLPEPAFSGLRFDPQPPAQGKKADSLWVGFHPGYQVFWRYSKEDGAYLRYQAQEEGKPLEVFTDRLNGDKLTFENVIVMFVTYHRYDETLFNIDLKFITRMPALLFRDGKMYEIYWTTKNEDYELRTGKLRPVRFVDADGEPFPLKPGQTLAEMVQLYNPYYETVDSEEYRELINKQQPDSGNWAVYFNPPAFEPQKK